MIVLSGARLVTFNPRALDRDPTIAIWLFVVLTQIQIFLSLLATGFTAVMRTVLAMGTNVDTSEDTGQNTSGGASGYALGSIKKGDKQVRKQESHSSFAPYVGGGWRANTSRVKAAPNGAPEDDSSQRGILRHDDFDISIETVYSRK